MDFLILIAIFIFGLVFGSFLNVVIFRLHTKDSIVNSRSKCLFCSRQLAWYDLFPVFSFLSLRGKCRYCKKKISWQYPLVEIAAGIVFAALFSQIFQKYDFAWGNVLNFLCLAFIFFALIVIFVFDLRHYIIPDEVVFPAIGASFLLLLSKAFLPDAQSDLPLFYDYFGAAIFAGGFFLFLIWITQGKGMGGGDVKLGFLLGLTVGLANTLLTLFIAFCSGATVGIFLIVCGKKKMKSMLPFGPFLIFGFLISYFWGSEIIGWYWGTFLL